MYQSQGQADHNAADGAVLCLGGHAQNCDHEYKGEDDFDDEGNQNIPLIKQCH